MRSAASHCILLSMASDSKFFAGAGEAGAGALCCAPGRARIGCLCKVLVHCCYRQVFMQVRERLEQGQVPKNKYIITKQLTKNPKDYPDARNQPHVQVALRRQAAGKRDGVMQVCAGDL